MTICTQNRECLLGETVDGEIHLNSFGEITHKEWQRTAAIRSYVLIDAFVVMPNHVHGIIIITSNNVGATRRVAPTNPPRGPASRSIGAIVGQFKSAVTKRINILRNTPGIPCWQRNYYEHVIRDEYDLNNTRQYILDNPANWETDENNIMTGTVHRACTNGGK